MRCRFRAAIRESKATGLLPCFHLGGGENWPRDWLVSNVCPSPDLQKQRHQFALAMCVRLGKDGFQLIARRLP
jgi:hypothetical protein